MSADARTVLRIVVGVSGGIAAYKAVAVVRGFVKLGHDVHVVATEAALRFVGKPTFEAISRNPVETDLYEGVAEVRHVAIGKSADLIVIAPATANTIAKLAAGIADDLLGNTVLASTAPLVVAPAMHTEMWRNPATVANIAMLRERGATVVGPATGALTGTDEGTGRLEEPQTIIHAALAALRPHDLAGKRIVVTAGGTREPLDPVRFLGNRSSGRQGVALATAARDRGADVTLIAAHLEVEPPSGVRVIPAGTARELQDAVGSTAADADLVIMAAAVADYRPAETRQAKIKKEDSGKKLSLRLVQNPDILVSLAANARQQTTVVGFAAETVSDRDELLKIGRAKLARKGCDFLVVNAVGWQQGFATESNDVVVLERSGNIVLEASGSKLSVAHRILDSVATA